MKKTKQDMETKAVALSYNETKDSEPRVIAKGMGVVADNIIEMAKTHNIPIQEDAALVELMGELRLNESIPEELYQVIAEIFAFIYQVDKSLKETRK